jgi:hypothetical protein
VESVANGYWNGVYVVGRPGSSKTHTVEEKLKDLGVPFIVRNAQMTPTGLFDLMKEHPDHVIVLDDISSLFGQKPAVQLLMAALGGEAGEPRTVTYTTKHEKEQIEFRGGIVAISNLALADDELAKALKSRVNVLNHEPSNEELLAFMRHLALKGDAGLSPAECLEVVDFVVEESQKLERPPDLRTMRKALQDRRQWKEGKSKTHWHGLVRSGIAHETAATNGRAQTKQQKLAKEREKVRRLVKKYPNDPKRQLEESGLKRSKFYRLRRELGS